MPYSNIDELPEAVRGKYGPKGLRAFLAAFNSTMDACDGDDCEKRAFGVAHSAAQQAEKTTTELSPLVEIETGLLGKLKSILSQTKKVAGFKVIEEMDDRWVAWYSNAFGPDKDDEFISTKAIYDDVARMTETGTTPELWFFHLRGSNHGKADAVGTVGRFAVATGTFDDTPIAQVFKSFYKSEKNTVAMSFGFDYDDSKKRDGVYYDVKTFEVSTVTPARFAANPFTVFDIYGIKEMENQIEGLKAIFADHPELLEQIVSKTEEASKMLENTTAYKTSITERIEEVQAEEKVDDMVAQPDTMRRDEVAELLEAAMRKMESSLKGMFTDFVGEMEKRYSMPQKEDNEKSAHDPLLMKMVEEMEKQIENENREIKTSELTPHQNIEIMRLGSVEAYERRYNVKVVD